MTLREKLKDDRGSLTAAMVIWTPIIIVLTSFVVDVGFLISNRDKADNVAEQVARRVADDLDAGPLRENPPRLVVNLDTAPAQAAGTCMTDAVDFLTVYNAGRPRDQQVDLGTVNCTVAGNSTAPGANASIPVVTVQITMPSKRLIGTFNKLIPASVTGTGTASPVSG